MVLAAATAILVVAQIGIIVLSRPRRIRDAVFLALPAIGLGVLLVAAWLTVS